MSYLLPHLFPDRPDHSALDQEAKVRALAGFIEAVLSTHDPAWAGRVRTHLSPILTVTGAKGRTLRRAYMNGDESGRPGVARLVELDTSGMAGNTNSDSARVTDRLDVAIYLGAPPLDSRAAGGQTADAADAVRAQHAATFRRLLSCRERDTPGILYAIVQQGVIVCAADGGPRLADDPGATLHMELIPDSVQKGLYQPDEPTDERNECTFSLLLT